MTTLAPRTRISNTPKLSLFKLGLEAGHPEDYGYGQTEGYVIAAKTEADARNIAAENDNDIWLDATITTCKNIAYSSKFTESKIVLKDYTSG